MCMFCRSLFVLLYIFFWPLCCLFFFDIRILITPLVSSNSSYREPSIDASYQFRLIWLSGFWEEIDQSKQELPMATKFVNGSVRWAKISPDLLQLKIKINKDNHKMRYLVVKKLLTLPEHLSPLFVFRGVRVAQSWIFCVMVCTSLCVLLAIVLSVCLQFTASDYTLISFKLFVAF
jgi:hypothetical protein